MDVSMTKPVAPTASLLPRAALFLSSQSSGAHSQVDTLAIIERGGRWGEVIEQLCLEASQIEAGL